MGDDFSVEIIDAMDASGVHKKIKVMLQQDKIQILNSQNKPLFAKEITQAANIDSEEEFDEVELD